MDGVRSFVSCDVRCEQLFNVTLVIEWKACLDPETRLAIFRGESLLTMAVLQLAFLALVQSKVFITMWVTPQRIRVLLWVVVLLLDRSDGFALSRVSASTIMTRNAALRQRGGATSSKKDRARIGISVSGKFRP